MSGTQTTNNGQSGIFSQYDPAGNSPDVAGEIQVAAASPVEITNFLTVVTMPNGIQMAEPIWTLDDIIPYIEANMVTTQNFGTAYDYMPDSLAKDLYGCHDLMPLLMSLNGASARDEFVGPVFTIVRITAAGQLMQALSLGSSRAETTQAAVQPVTDLTLIPVPYLGQ